MTLCLKNVYILGKNITGKNLRGKFLPGNFLLTPKILRVGTGFPNLKDHAQGQWPAHLWLKVILWVLSLGVLILILMMARRISTASWMTTLMTKMLAKMVPMISKAWICFGQGMNISNAILHIVGPDWKPYKYPPRTSQKENHITLVIRFSIWPIFLFWNIFRLKTV